MSDKGVYGLYPFLHSLLTTKKIAVFGEAHRVRAAEKLNC